GGGGSRGHGRSPAAIARQCFPPGRLPRLPLPTAGDIPLYASDLEEDLTTVSRNRLAETITGGLSMISKMPCPSWGISAFRCRVGSVLARTEGTTCSTCYARKGRYSFGKVQAKLEERY